MSKKVFFGFAVASAVLYAFCLFHVLFISFGRGAMMRSVHFRFGDAMNLIPFKTIAEYSAALIEGKDSATAIMNIAGNLFLLLPLGFYLPFFVRQASKMKVFVPVVAVTIIIIESLQSITMTGSMDIDDFILNLSGALIGISICKQVPILSLLRLRAG